MLAGLKNTIFILLLFALLGFGAYANSLNAPFQFDDKDYIINNTSLREGINPGRIFQYPWSKARFVTFLTFAANYQISKLNTFSYHLVNLLIHLANAALVWRFILLLFAAGQNKQLQERNPEWIALLAALLFLVHPIQTQAVTYISQRFASLATLFYLSTLIFYLKARHHNNVVFLVLAVCSGVLSMFTKQIALTLPLNILLVEWLFLKDRRGGRLFQYGLILVIGLTLVIPALYKFDIASILTRSGQSLSHEGDFLTPWTYFLTEQRVILRYLWLLVLPAGQNILHDVPMSQSLFDPPTTFLSFLFILTALAAACTIRQNRPLAAYGIFWFFLCLSVESSFITIQHVMFEHRVYLPSVGFFLVFSILFFRLIQNARARLLTGALVVLTLSLLTFQRNTLWGSPISLWEDAAKKSPGLLRPHVKLGVAYLKEEQYQQALLAFQKALEINPAHPGISHNIRITAQRMGRRLIEHSIRLKKNRQHEQALDYALKARSLGVKVPSAYIEELQSAVSRP